MVGGEKVSPERLALSRPRFLDSGVPCVQSGTLAAAGSGPGQPAATALSRSSIDWRTDIASVIGEAGSSRKKILVFFHSPGAGTSEHIRATILSDLRVVSVVNERMVPLQINVNEQSALAAQLGVFRGGVVGIYGPDGVALKRFTSVSSPEAFLSSLP